VCLAQYQGGAWGCGRLPERPGGGAPFCSTQCLTYVTEVLTVVAIIAPATSVCHCVLRRRVCVCVCEGVVLLKLWAERGAVPVGMSRHTTNMVAGRHAGHTSQNVQL